MVVALAGDDADARERAVATVTECYWRPLYKYARVAWHRSREDAEDLTQSFFVRVLEKDSLASFDPSRAAFRTFLRLLFERHLSNDWKSNRRLKRGGGDEHLDFENVEGEIAQESSGVVTPEEYFQREWIRSVFAVAVERLRDASDAEGRQTQYAIFEAYDLDDDRSVSYRALASRFGLPETQVTNYLAATRRRFRAIVLDALRELTATEEEFRSEARALLGGTW